MNNKNIWNYVIVCKQMSSDLFKDNVINKPFFYKLYIYIYIYIYIYRERERERWYVGRLLLRVNLKLPVYNIRLSGRAQLLSLDWSTLPWLIPYNSMLSQEDIKYHFWVFGMIWPGIEPRSPIPLVKTLSIMPMLERERERQTDRETERELGSFKNRQQFLCY